MAAAAVWNARWPLNMATDCRAARSRTDDCGAGDPSYHHQTTPQWSEIMDQKNLGELYELDPLPWSRALEALEDQTSRDARCFLATTRPDGRPHVAGVGALWDDGKVYVVSGPGTRKSQNLAAKPNCAVSVALPSMDLVFDSSA